MKHQSKHSEGDTLAFVASICLLIVCCRCEANSECHRNHLLRCATKYKKKRERDACHSKHLEFLCY